MAYFTGTTASLKLSTSTTPGTAATATTAVGQLESFSVEETVEMLPVTKLGSTTKDKVPSYKDFTINLSGHLDYTDSGVKLLTVGDLVDFEIAPSTTTSSSGALKLTGQAYIESFSANASAGDTTKFSATLSGVGALTKAEY